MKDTPNKFYVHNGKITISLTSSNECQYLLRGINPRGVYFYLLLKDLKHNYEYVIFDPQQKQVPSPRFFVRGGKQWYVVDLEGELQELTFTNWESFHDYENTSMGTWLERLQQTQAASLMRVGGTNGY